MGVTWDPEVVTAASARLLAEARAKTRMEIVALGVRPRPRAVPRGQSVIWIRGEGAPIFQFDNAGELRPIVDEVNRLLGATSDPWGVASWWLESNIWLGDRRPIDLVDGPQEVRLLRAARLLLRDPD